MVPITSSAASETDSARNFVPGTRAPARRITSTPPPPGRCTSSSTTSGWCADTAATASSASAASACTSTTPRPARSSSARTPRRNIAWSSTITIATGRCSAIALLLSGQVQPHLGPLTGRRPDLGRSPVSLHAVDDALADAVPVLGHRLEVEPLAAVADEHVDRTGRHLGVHVDLAGAGVLRRVGHRLAGRVHDREQRLVEGTVADVDD